jgi:hypothetical protein
MDYKEYSCPSVKRFDFSQLPPGRYALRESKIILIDDEVTADFEAAANKLEAALKRLIAE